MPRRLFLVQLNPDTRTVGNSEVAILYRYHTIQHFLHPRLQKLVETLLDKYVGNNGAQMSADESLNRALRVVYGQASVVGLRQTSYLDRAP